jgi:two-component system response regulator NreC
MKGKAKIRVLLVEDHSIVREGLQMMLDNEVDIKVIGEAPNGQEAMKLIEATKPDVVLMDLNMPLMSGIECTRQIKLKFPEVRVLILSMHDQESYLLDILNCGAEGFVIKNTRKAELVFAIRKVMDGGVYIGPEFTMKMLARTNAGNNVPAVQQNYIRLSAGEKSVLDLILTGLTNKEMAQKLFTSVRTIETRRKKILEKTGTNNTATLVKFAILNGL